MKTQLHLVHIYVSDFRQNVLLWYGDKFCILLHNAKIYISNLKCKEIRSHVLFNLLCGENSIFNSGLITS